MYFVRRGFSRMYDDRTYQFCLFNCNKQPNTGHRINMYQIFEPAIHFSSCTSSHARQDFKCWRFVAPFVAGCQLGGKRTLAEIRDKRSMHGVVLADVATAIGPSHTVHGWRVGDADPLSAVL